MLKVRFYMSNGRKTDVEVSSETSFKDFMEKFAKSRPIEVNNGCIAGGFIISDVQAFKISDISMAYDITNEPQKNEAEAQYATKHKQTESMLLPISSCRELGT